MRNALAQSVDPSLQWSVLETPHFHIVYDSRHYWLAQRYAGFAEQAYQALQPVFIEAPAKTTTDSSIGSHTGRPAATVMAPKDRPTMPSARHTRAMSRASSRPSRAVTVRQIVRT